MYMYVPATQEKADLHQLLDDIRLTDGLVNGHSDNMKKWPVAMVSIRTPYMYTYMYMYIRTCTVPDCVLLYIHVRTCIVCILYSMQVYTYTYV